MRPIGSFKERLKPRFPALVWALAVAVGLSISCPDSRAQSTALADRVSAIEQRAGVSSSAEHSLVDRVCAVEIKVFGSQKTGSLVERIDRVTSALNPQVPAADPSSASAGSDTSSQSTGADPLYPASIANPPDGSPSQVSPRGQTSPTSIVILDLFPPNNTAPPHFVRIPPPGKNDKLAEDYYTDVMKATKNKVFRYKAMPVPVYITPYPDRRFTEACIKGFENWEERTNGVVRFVQVEDSLKARIRVIWSHLGVATDANDCTLGAHTVTKWKTKAPGKVSFMSVGAVPVPVYIPTLGPKVTVQPQVIEVNLDLIAIKDEEIRMFVLQNVVTHELGHALGLLGHSQERSDMMFPVTDENSRLSARDINTLLKIYELKPDIPL